MNGKTISYAILCILFMLLMLAACRTIQEQQVVAGPTRTPTPISTPLPVVPTAIPPGAEGNPIRIVIRPSRSLSDDEREAAAAALTAAVQAKTKLDVEVVTVNRYAEALAALCDSGGGQVSISWLDGVSYFAAIAQNCGQPTLQVRRSTSREIATGISGQIIVNADLGVTGVAALRERIFCRLNSGDFFSWLLPTLVFKSARMDPLRDFEAVNDYEAIPALVKAVAAGECDAAGIAEDAFEQFSDELSEVRDRVKVIATTVPFPYDVLLYPIEVQLGVQLALDDALIDLASAEGTAETLRSLLGQDELVRVQPDDFADLNTFMTSTGLNFAQLGN